MRKLELNCIDCGSPAIETIIDEVKPVYRASMTHYSCGAVLTSSSGAYGRLARISHEGCTADLQI